MVESVNVGAPVTVEWEGRQVSTAIWKRPVAGPVAVAGVNLAGDDQADRAVHGGTDKAVYAYAGEDLDWWTGQLGRPLAPGTFGENLTVRGLAVTGAVIGERWRVGTAVVEGSLARIPCNKLGTRMGDPSFPRRFAAAARPGAYLRILEPGAVSAGDTAEVMHRPGHGLTVGDAERAYHADHS